MPKLRWQSAHGYAPPIAEGGTMDSCMLGDVEVGRVQRVGSQGAWICWLPRRSGVSYAGWKYERSWLAARALGTWVFDNVTHTDDVADLLNNLNRALGNPPVDLRAQLAKRRAEREGK